MQCPRLPGDVEDCAYTSYIVLDVLALCWMCYTQTNRARLGITYRETDKVGYNYSNIHLI